MAIFHVMSEKVKDLTANPLDKTAKVPVNTNQQVAFILRLEFIHMNLSRPLMRAIDVKKCSRS